jgi:multimeric flavodoxin WrbA
VARALREMETAFAAEGIETVTLHVGAKPVRGCLACGKCRSLGRCVFNDAVNEAAAVFKEADGLVLGSPVYYAHANGGLLAFADRLFYSAPFDKRFKVGAAVVSSRRAGSTSAFDDINKYFTISGMPVASSTYWNEVHGFSAADVERDAEGLQTMRNLARNMAFLMKSIALGKETYGLPETERGAFTSFLSE